MVLTFSLFISFLAVRGFRYEVTSDGLLLRNTQSFLWLLLLIFFVFVLKKSIKEKDRCRVGCAALFGGIVSAFYLLGVSLEKMGRISWIWINAGYAANAANLFFSYAVLYYSFAYLSFGFLARQRAHDDTGEKRQFSSRRVLLFWAILTLIYLPWYLSNYPGVITQDSADQIGDAITVESIRDHHSVFLTLMMRIVILPIRHFSGSLQLGVGICSLLQMLIVTFVFALAYEWSCQYLGNRVLRFLCFGWYAFYPINSLYSVTFWKDVLFSVSFLGLMISMDDALRNERIFFSSKWKMLTLSLLMVMLPLMRHNGISISVVIAVCLLIRFRHYRKQTCAILGIFILLFSGWKLIMLPALNATEISSGNSLSILEQQMARAMNVHHDELTEEEIASYSRYFDIEDLWSRYNPILSDSVKKHFRDDLFRQDPVGFFSLWASLGSRYPVDYIEAFLANNYGYWFPETTYWIFSIGIAEKGLIEDIHEAPILRISVMEKVLSFIESGQYEKTPLLPLLFSRGACFWLWIFCGCHCLYNNRGKFILFMAGFALWLGILISPVYNEYRYVYGLFAGLPLLLVVTLSSSSSEKH